MSLQCTGSRSLPAVSLRAYFQQALADCRQLTLNLVADAQPELLKRQAHADFSPVGWHLGHIAYTESLWTAEHLADRAGESHYLRLFAADGLPKAERENLPDWLEILAYLGEVRSQTLKALFTTDLLVHAPLWHWLLQHESQHAETMAMVLALHRLEEAGIPGRSPQSPLPDSDMVYVSGGESVQGSNLPAAIDNERPAHAVSLAGYWIDRTPVTCEQYRQFIEAGGYQQAQWWTPEGWQWQQSAQVKAPLYWTNTSTFDQHPVCGVSWYEAEAYARFVGKRLPTEAEWAKAAGWDALIGQSRLYPWGDSLRDECNYGQQTGATTQVGQFVHTSPYGCKDMLGNVWEWTDTWFAGYPGFRPFPYAGYSQVYFDQAHRVLRGGSWATPRWALRNSFRNWYHPHRREAFAGFRCAAKER